MVGIDDPQSFIAVCIHAGLTDLPEAEQCYGVVQFLARQDWSLTKAGLIAYAADSPEALLKKIDAEAYKMAQAHYEQSFKIPV